MTNGLTYLSFLEFYFTFYFMFIKMGFIAF